KNTYVYEQTDSPKNLRAAFDYDNYGNLIREFQYGQVDPEDFGVGQDEVLTYTDYAYNESAWIMDQPAHITKTDLAGRIVAEQKRYYDGPDWVGLPYGQVVKGHLMRQEERLGPNGAGGNPCPEDLANRCINTIRNRYDAYGNVIGIMDAL